MAPEKIGKDVVVSLHYKLWLDDGSLADESEANDPLVYLHGHDNIIPGLERQLDGLRAGDQKTLIVEPDDAYGDYDPDSVDEVSRSELPPNLNPEEGMLLSVTDQEGNQLIAQITEVGDDYIVLDFNHPMAGERLHFEVTIADLRAATSEELAHGHVHTHGHHH